MLDARKISTLGRVPAYLAAAALALLSSLALVGGAAADAAAGKISRLKGEANAARGAVIVVLAEGSEVFVNDKLQTGKGARVEVTFVDETKLTLGANATLTVDQFVFKPETNEGSVLLGVVKGAFRFTTGKLKTVANRKIEVKTGFANLAVRGTDFWGGPIDGANGVLVLDGEVEVATKSGSVLLNSERAGTMVANINRKPGKRKEWSDEKIARAVATISF